MLKTMFSFKNFHPSTRLVTDAPDVCRHEVRPLFLSLSDFNQNCWLISIKTSQYGMS